MAGHGLLPYILGVIRVSVALPGVSMKRMQEVRGCSQYYKSNRMYAACFEQVRELRLVLSPLVEVQDRKGST